ncbi:hypothetical protein [Nocardioides sp. YIM 152315]|uniref:hypothetical protein n=1 Tax=Nocardioides sp. YIM 152315 TaxID=3031760 RepID=UPI0023DB92BE|nr:hypothetical protein [Nocardioides sp. YIM 152315]MDF1605714.1 hypothetical protein [Nocardioides sp. YIM 152315]
MTAPIPEDQDQPPVGTGRPPGEHPSDLPSGDDRATPSAERVEHQVENAETSLDEPSDDTGGE